MTTPRPDAPKSAWRAWARVVRTLKTAGATDEPGTVRDAAIHTHVSEWELFRRAQHVLLYLPMAGEVDLTPLTADSAETAGASRTYYVTRTWPDPGRPLSVHAYDPSALERHRYGFAQPMSTAAPVDPALLDIALVPGLAFDASGTRLGYGRGYFDRLLAEIPSTTPRVGIAPLATVVPRLPREPHDVAMDYLATESGIRAVVRTREPDSGTSRRTREGGTP